MVSVALGVSKAAKAKASARAIARLRVGLIDSLAKHIEVFNPAAT